MRDCYYERDTGIGILEIITSRTESRDVRWREFMKKLIFSVHEKHQANRLSSIQEAVGLFSDTLQLLRGNEKYIRSEVAN